MIDSTAVSSVRTIDPRGIVTNTMNKTPGSEESAEKKAGETQKPTGQDVKANENESPHGALTNFREGVREFTFGVLQPVSGIVGEKVYETSISQTMENLRKKYNGALTGFHKRVHGFAFGIMRPETGVIGEETYDSSHSVTMGNLSKEYIGAVAGIRNTLHQYANAAMESAGPLVPIAESIQVFEREFQDTSAVVASQNTQDVDVTV
jgi:hypothetical protein